MGVGSYLTSSVNEVVKTHLLHRLLTATTPLKESSAGSASPGKKEKRTTSSTATPAAVSRDSSSSSEEGNDTAATSCYSSSFLSQMSGGCGGAGVRGQGSRDQQRLEEKSDRISKEKQKFFRLSAFYADHKFKRVGRLGTTVTAAAKVGKGRGATITSSSSSSSSGDDSDSATSMEEGVKEVKSPASAKVLGCVSTMQHKQESSSSNNKVKVSASLFHTLLSRQRPRPVRTIPSPAASFPTVSMSSIAPSTVAAAAAESGNTPWGFAAAAARNKSEGILGSFSKPAPETAKFTQLLGSLQSHRKGKKSGGASSVSMPTFASLSASCGAVKMDSGNSSSSNLSQKEEKATGSSSSSSSSYKLQPGFGQLKGLFDGLSHLFTTPTHNRTRTGTINYNPNRKKQRSLQKLQQTQETKKPTAGQAIPSQSAASVMPFAASVPVMAKVKSSDSGIMSTKAVPPLSLPTGRLSRVVTLQQKQSDASPNIAIPKASIKTETPLSRTGPVQPPAPPASRKVPRPGIFVPSSEMDFPSLTPLAPPEPENRMTPSRLVKTAVNSKRLEQERRRWLKGDGPPFFGAGAGGSLGTLGYMMMGRSLPHPFLPMVSLHSATDDPKLKKKNLIAEATQTHHRYHHHHHHHHRYHHPLPLPVPVPSTSIVQTLVQTGKNPPFLLRVYFASCFL